MAINFPDSPSNGDTTTLAGKTYTYDSSKSKWSPSGGITLSSLSVGSEGTASGDGGIAYNSGSGVFTFTPAVAAGTGVTVHANQTAMIAASADEGSLHYENANNRLYVKAASGFYLLATISNVTPTITGLTQTTDGTTATVADAATFTLTSGQNTVITLAASDPDVGQSLTYSATLTAGTLSNVASSFTQGSGADVNKFTIVPQTSGSGGTINYRFDVTDGVGTAQRTASFSIAFIIANSRYTSLLMSANAAGTNSTFTDSSSSGHTITPSGDPTQGSFSPYRKGSYSWSFAQGSAGTIGTGANDYALKLADSADLDAGSGVDFTYEFWFKASGSSTLTLNSLRNVYFGGSGWMPMVQIHTDNKVRVYINSAYKPTATVLSRDVWNHVCILRASNVWKIYLNGTEDTAGSYWPFTESSATVAQGVWLGDNGVDLRDFRFVIGTAIVPPSGGPSEPLSVVSGTKFLLCSLPYFADANNTTDGGQAPKTITHGDFTSTTIPSGPYDYSQADATDGGSIELDGSGDSLALASGSITAPTGDFNLQFWAYPKSNSANITVYDSAWLSNGICIFYHTSQTYYVFLGAGSHTLNGVGGDAPVNSWHHLCLTRNGSNIKLYLNGKEVDTTSTSVTFAQAAFNATTIGMRHQTSNRQYWNGLVSDLKFDSSNAITGEFTPPIETLSSSGADVHLKGQGAKIFDKSQTQNFALSGATGNATNKGGNWANTFSTRLASTSDYVKFYDKPIIGTSDFTIEAFLKWDSTTGYNTALYSHYYTNSNRGVLMYNNKIYLTSASSASSWGPELNLGTPPSAGTWYHLAAVRNGANLYGFINGTRTATLNIGASFDVNDPDHATVFADNFGRIGAGRVLGITALGYISDFRITHGLARYTAADETGNIPTAPLKG